MKGRGFKMGKKTTKKKGTPIRRILIDRPYVKKRALEFIERLGIQTAEELVEKYTADDFACRDSYYIEKDKGGLEKRERIVENVGPRTIEYLNECLQQVGLKLQERRVKGQISSLEVLGENEARRIVLNALSVLKKGAEKSGYRGCYFSSTQIANESNYQKMDEEEGKLISVRDLRRRGIRTEYIFRPNNTLRLLGGRLSDSVESIVYLGPNGYQPLFRLKSK